MAIHGLQACPLGANVSYVPPKTPDLRSLTGVRHPTFGTTGIEADCTVRDGYAAVSCRYHAATGSTGVQHLPHH